MLAGIACRQDNPDWLGPAASTSQGADTASDTETSTDSGDNQSTGQTACSAPNESLCGTECVDLMTNDQHCGRCNNRCNGNRACVEGACEK
jgi:hypothetical protein